MHNRVNNERYIWIGAGENECFFVVLFFAYQEITWNQTLETSRCVERFVLRFVCFHARDNQRRLHWEGEINLYIYIFYFNQTHPHLQ